MERNKVCLIINPASAGGKTQKRAAQIIKETERYFGKNIQINFTRNGIDTAHSVREYIQNGCELLIVAGGDGTIQHVVNGFFKDNALISHDCKLGIVSSGTGQGFAQSLALPQSIQEQIEIIKNNITCPVDVGQINFCHIEHLTLYFVNEFQLGIGGAVVRNVKSYQKYLGGSLAFGISTLKTVFTHPNQYVYIETDKKDIISEKVTGIVIANGAYTGGGMNLAPKADLFDHLLNVLIIKEQKSLQRLMNFPKIYSGTHINNEHFYYCRVRELNVTFTEDILMEADGELISSLSCHVTVIPSAINVCISSLEVNYANTEIRTEKV